jgi:hypothetical protein
MNSYLLDAKITEKQTLIAQTSDAVGLMIKERQEICPHTNVVKAIKRGDYDEHKVCRRCGLSSFWHRKNKHWSKLKSNEEVTWEEALHIRHDLITPTRHGID